MKKVAIGQAGGPTAVINATLAGFVEHIKDTHEIILINSGYEGLVKENFLLGNPSNIEWVLSNQRVPRSLP